MDHRRARFPLANAHQSFSGFLPLIVYDFVEGQRESILRIISTAKSMLSRNAISRTGDGFPSNAVNFLHAKIAAMTPRVRLRPSSMI
jgi:hypothetical protein